MGETPGSVVTLLCSGMHFFNAEKRIADCVLEDTAGVAAMTSAELAHCSSTSEATVTRFCKKLGFENYRAFQLALARDVMERQPLEISNEVQLDNIPQSLQNILSNKIDEMSATINGINPENLQRVLKLLQNAQLVQIAAVGNTIPVAMDAAFKFNQLGMRCITSEISEKNSAFALTLTPGRAAADLQLRQIPAAEPDGPDSAGQRCASGADHLRPQLAAGAAGRSSADLHQPRAAHHHDGFCALPHFCHCDH